MAAVLEKKSETSLADLRERSQPAEAKMPAVRAGFSDLAGFELMQRGAKAFAASTLVPQQYQGNVPNCIIALELAQRIGASPLMVAQNLYVVHGRPSWSAQFLIAAVNQCGRFTALQYEWTGKPNTDEWTCRAWAKDKATGERVQGPAVSINMAKKEGWYTKNGSKWQSIPELMLMYRAATFFARTNAPELTMGLSTDDEAREVIDVQETAPGHFEASTTEIKPETPATPTQDAQESTDAPPLNPDEITLAKVLDYIERAPNADVANESLDLANKLTKAERAEAVKAFNKKWAEVVG